MFVEIAIFCYRRVVSDQKRESFVFGKIFNHVIAMSNFDIIWVSVLLDFVGSIRYLFCDCKRAKT